MVLSEGQERDLSAGGWQFGTRLTTDHVWDAFIILTLLDYSERKEVCLAVPHTGDQKDRFTAAMRERNREVRQEGQDEVDHCCDKCMREWVDPDTGEKRRLTLVPPRSVPINRRSQVMYRLPSLMASPLASTGARPHTAQKSSPAIGIASALPMHTCTRSVPLSAAMHQISPTRKPAQTPNTARSNASTMSAVRQPSHYVHGFKSIASHTHSTGWRRMRTHPP
jgi:hypothetical protein